jgi:hypothetical protein
VTERRGLTAGWLHDLLVSVWESTVWTSITALVDLLTARSCRGRPAWSAGRRFGVSVIVVRDDVKGWVNVIVFRCGDEDIEGQLSVSVQRLLSEWKW